MNAMPTLTAPATGSVAQVANLPYRRLPVGGASTARGCHGLRPLRRLATCETADWQSIRVRLSEQQIFLGSTRLENVSISSRSISEWAFGKKSSIYFRGWEVGFSKFFSELFFHRPV
jgi:hypothetical protein